MMTNLRTLLATLSDGLIFFFIAGTTWQTKFWHQEVGSMSGGCCWISITNRQSFCPGKR
jgi:hypothetical protein